MSGKRVLHSDERGKKGAVSYFPPLEFQERHGSLSEWEEIRLLYEGGEYARQFGKKRPKRMICILSFLIAGGDFFAKNFLGTCYQRGDFEVEEDPEKAIALYRDAALSQQVPVACFNLGMMYWFRGYYCLAIESFIAGRQLGCNACKARLCS